MSKNLHKKEIQSIIIEGGAKTLQNFIHANLWDEPRVFTGNIFLLSGTKAPVFNVKPKKSFNIMNDESKFFENYD